VQAPRVLTKLFVMVILFNGVLAGVFVTVSHGASNIYGHFKSGAI
jgi:hypothetical protein